MTVGSNDPVWDTMRAAVRSVFSADQSRLRAELRRLEAARDLSIMQERRLAGMLHALNEGRRRS